MGNGLSDSPRVYQEIFTISLSFTRNLSEGKDPCLSLIVISRMHMVLFTGVCARSLSQVRLFVSSLSGCSVHEIFQARILERVAISSSRDLPNPGIKPASPALAGRCFTSELAGKQFYGDRWHQTLGWGWAVNTGWSLCSQGQYNWSSLMRKHDTESFCFILFYFISLF